MPDATGAALGSLVVLSSLQEALRPVGRLRLVLLGIAGGGVLLAFVFSLVLSRSVTRPVNRLLEETVRLGSGDLRHPVVAERADEIGELAEGFDRMRVSLHSVRENLIRAERLSAVGQAVSAVVHDFRQPLTVIKAHVDLLAEDGEDAESRLEDLATVSRDIDRLER